MEIDISVLLMTLVNFFILVLILKHFFWKKIKKAVEDREEYVQEQLSKADEDSQKARMYLVENERILKASRAEGKKIIEQKKAKANSVYDEIIEEANQEAKSLVNRAKVEIAREREKAEYELKKEVVTLAMDLTSKVLEEKLSNNTQRELINDYITKVGS